MLQGWNSRTIARPGSKLKPRETYDTSYVPFCRERGIEPVSFTRFGLVVALAGEHNVFLDLANTVASCSPYKNSPKAAEAAHAFIKKWGMLSAISADRPLSSTVEAFLGRATLMRKALTDAERTGWQLPPSKIASLRGVTLEKGLTLQPKTLFDFCRLEFVSAVNAGLRFYRCGNRACGKYGLLRERVGVDESQGGSLLNWRPGRDREFCSEPCRKKAQRAREARARAA